MNTSKSGSNGEYAGFGCRYTLLRCLLLLIPVLITASASPQPLPQDSTTARLQTENLQESVEQEEKLLKEQGRQIDLELKKLYQNKALQAKDREEFIRLRNELLAKKKQINSKRVSLNEKKRRLSSTKLVDLQKQKQQTGKSSAALVASVSQNEKIRSLAESPPSPQQDTVQQETLPKIGSETATPKPAIDETALAQQAASLAGAVAADSAKTSLEQHGTAKVVAGQAVEAGVSAGTQLAESWFDQFGKARIDIQMDDEFRLSSYEFDYLMPYYNSEKASAFMQLGFRNWTGRDILNLGLGYRHFNRGWMFGVNAFIDSDLSYGHQRGSLGVEAMTSYVKGYSNFYMPLSDWQDVGMGLEAQAASGIDVGVEVQVGWVPGLSLSAEYFKWFGDHVDMAGGFEDDISAESFDALAEDPEGLTVGIEYRPVPLLGISVERTVGGEEVRNTTLGIDLTWSFDTALSKQLRPVEAATVGSVESMRESFVERESNIILSYREAGSEDGSSGLQVTLSESYLVPENQQLQIDTDVKSASGISSHQWSGDGVNFLVDSSSLTPTFSAGYWDPTPDSNNHSLTLTVTDLLGRKATANTTVVVQEDTGLRPIVTITDGSSPITSLSLDYGTAPLQLGCTVQSKRSPRSGDSNKNSYQWEGDTALLTAVDVPDPSVDPQLPPLHPPAPYNLNLTVDMATGETGIASLPVTITEAHSGLAWVDTQGEIDNNNTVSKTLVEPSFQIKAESNYQESDGQISYRIIGDPTVATLAGEGNITLGPSVGIVQVVAKQDASKNGNYRETEVSYDLKVEKATGTPLTAKSTSVAVPVSTTYNANNNLNGGNQGSLIYKLDSNSIASISTSGVVTGLVDGVTKLTVTEEESANYLEQSVEYSIDVFSVVALPPTIQGCSYTVPHGSLVNDLIINYTLGGSGDTYAPAGVRELKAITHYQMADHSRDLPLPQHAGEAKRYEWYVGIYDIRPSSDNKIPIKLRVVYIDGTKLETSEVRCPRQ